MNAETNETMRKITEKREMCLLRSEDVNDEISLVQVSVSGERVYVNQALLIYKRHVCDFDKCFPVVFYKHIAEKFNVITFDRRGALKSW